MSLRITGQPLPSDKRGRFSLGGRCPASKGFASSGKQALLRQDRFQSLPEGGGIDRGIAVELRLDLVEPAA